MKLNSKEPVLVLANGVGLWRHYGATGTLTYSVRQVRNDQEFVVEMSPDEWELIHSAIKTDEFNEENVNRKERFDTLYPPKKSGGS